MDAQGVEEGIDAALVEFVASLFPPLRGEVGAGSVEGFGDLEEMSLGMEDVDALDGAGEVLIGEVPDPGGAVAEDDLAFGLVEAGAPIQVLPRIPAAAALSSKRSNPPKVALMLK